MQNVKARMNVAANSVKAEVHQMDQIPTCGGPGTKDKPFQYRYVKWRLEQSYQFFVFSLVCNTGFMGKITPACSR